MKNENVDQTTAIVEAGESRPITPILSIYRSSNDTHGSTVTLQAVRERILDGKRGLDEKTRYCNALVITDPPVYKIYKEKNLPAVTFSGTFPKGKRKAQHLIRHSGYITVDVDGLTANQIASLLAELAQMPHVVMAFISPSGKGIKVIVRVNPIPTNDIEHKGAYQACLDFFEDLADEYGFEIDTSGKDCSRLCYLTHDPLAVYHENTVAIDWDKDAWIQEQNERAARFEIEANKAYTGEADVKALDHIDPNDLDYNQWLSVITAGKAAGLSWQQVDAWSRCGGVRYTEGEVESRWDGLHLDVSWGAVVNLAKENGYKPPRRNRKPIKLQNLTPYKRTLETLWKARDFIKEVYEKSAQLFALRTDTGTGKTEYAATTYALAHETVISTTSHSLASEISNRATEKDIYNFVYKGIEYQADPKHGYQIDGITHDQSGYFGCTHSKRFEILRSRGFNPYEHICGNCESYLKCKESGYLSQPDKARNAQLVTLPFATAFLDPRLKNWAKLYRPRGKNALILHDDIPTSQLFIEYHLTAAHLRQIYQDWTGTLAAEWAKECLTAFSLQDWELLKNTINGMSGDTYKSVTDALTHCINPSTNAVIEPDEYLKLERVNYESPESCLKLPQVNKPSHDAATMLKDFFTRYTRIPDAPFFYDQKEEKLTFYLPPKPYIFNKSVRLGFASATMEKELMQTIFPEIEFHDASLTHWVDGAGFYQLRTNGNPRRTVLKNKLIEKDGKKIYVYDGLSTTGQKYYDKVINFIKAHPHEKHALLCYKAVIDEKKCELDTLGVVTAWFGNLAGLDTEFAGVKHFHILFCPEVGDMGIDMLLKQVYGNDETPILRNDKGELLRNDNRTFADERAQLVYLSLVISEIRQAIGRSRLNLYPNKVYLWTSRFIDGYTNRKKSILFDENDWEYAGENLDDLAKIVTDREKHEKVVEQAIEKGDAKAVAELKGVSQGHARKITQEPKKNQRMELARQVSEMIDSGMSQRAVETELKISRKKITKLLNEYKAVHNAHALKGLLNVNDQNAPPPENSDDTGVESVQLPKTDRDAQVIALHKDGVSQREIHSQMKADGHKVSLGTVNKVIQVFRMRQPAISTSYSRLAGSVTPTNPDDTRIECKILNASEPEPHHSTFFKLLEISTCFYGKKQLSASDISQRTGIDESEVRRILDNWYKAVVISPGIGDQYWMTERNKKNLWDKILGPAFTQWTENFPGKKTLCPPITFKWIGTGPGPGIHVLP